MRPPVGTTATQRSETFAPTILRRFTGVFPCGVQQHATHENNATRATQDTLFTFYSLQIIMAKIKKVVLRLDGDTYSVCHTAGGLYNAFAKFDTEQAARDYCDAHGYTCRRRIIHGGSWYVNENR